MTITDPTYLEAVYAALFSQLQGAQFAAGVALTTTFRSVVPPDTVGATDQPALVLIQGSLQPEQKQLLAGAELTRWMLTAVAAIYVRADADVSGQGILSATTLNYLIWGLANSFETSPPGTKNTLGGLVENAWVEGPVSFENVGEQLVATLPIMMLAGPVG